MPSKFETLSLRASGEIALDRYLGSGACDRCDRLFGALIGAWATMWVDRRRRADERIGFNDTIRMDLAGYAETCRRLADEWIVDPKVRPPLDWLAVSPSVASHLPYGVRHLLNWLDVQRGGAQVAYDTLSAGLLELPVVLQKPLRRMLVDMYGARFMLRKYVCLVQVVMEEWGRYEQRSMWERMSHWPKHDRLDDERKYKDVDQLIVSRSRSLLVEMYGYMGTSEELEHRPDKAAMEELADELGVVLQNAQEDLRDASRGEH